MPVGTIVCKLDLAGDRSFSTDISAYLDAPQSFAADGFGSGPARLGLTLDNRDGRFSPAKAAGPYFGTLKPGVLIQVQVSWNAVTYDYFSGMIVEIEVLAEPGEKQARLTCVDFQTVLSSEDTRLPLMVNQYTGVIIHRLLDYSERGEIVGNERFGKDTTGWAVFGGGNSLTRVTTEPKPLHQPGAAELLNCAVGGGARYLLDSDQAGQKVTLVAYLKPYSYTEVGQDVILRMRSNAASIATVQGTLDADKWLRLELTNTYPGGTTAWYLDIERPSGGAANVVIGAIHAVRAAAAIPRAIDGGVARLENISYNRDTKASQALAEVAENELGGQVFFDGAGYATYHDRAHRWRVAAGNTSQASFTDAAGANKAPHKVGYKQSLQDRFSEVRFYFARWERGEPGSVVFSLAPVPRRIGPGEELSLEIPYNGGLVRDTITPIGNIDYTINSSPDGDGVDESAGVSLKLQDFGGGASLTLVNSFPYRVYLTMLQIRGTPVRAASDASPAVGDVTTPPALKNPLEHTFRLQASEAHMEAWADYHAARHGDAQQERVSLALSAPWPDAPTTSRLADVLNRKVGDRITVTQTVLPFASFVNGDYYIDSVGRVITSDRAEAVFALTPADARYWQIGHATYGKLDSGAPLGP